MNSMKLIDFAQATLTQSLPVTDIDSIRDWIRDWNGQAATGFVSCICFFAFRWLSPLYTSNYVKPCSAATTTSCNNAAAATTSATMQQDWGNSNNKCATMLPQQPVATMLQQPHVEPGFHIPSLFSHLSTGLYILAVLGQK